ncbi:hypothetical protein DV515_00000795, partial [Chloebia gouldiae]
MERFQGSEGKKEDEEKKYLDVISNKNIKLSERVLIPVKQYPKLLRGSVASYFNFVGKLLGPRGNSLKRLQEETGAKMSILGKGSMRDKAKVMGDHDTSKKARQRSGKRAMWEGTRYRDQKSIFKEENLKMEEELRKSGEAKYAHLSDELHVLIEVFAPPGEAYSRMSHALEEIKKFLVPGRFFTSGTSEEIILVQVIQLLCTIAQSTCWHPQQIPILNGFGEQEMNSLVNVANFVRLFEDSNTSRYIYETPDATNRSDNGNGREQLLGRMQIVQQVLLESLLVVTQRQPDKAFVSVMCPVALRCLWSLCQPGCAFAKLSQSTTFQKVSPFGFQDYNDEIRQEQLRELSYLNGSEDSSRGRGIRGRGIRVPPAAPSRGRGGAIPPPLPGRGAQAPRGAPVTRGALPVPPVARGVPTPRARGAPSVPGYRPPPPPAHEPYDDYVSTCSVRLRSVRAKLCPGRRVLPAAAVPAEGSSVANALPHKGSGSPHYKDSNYSKEYTGYDDGYGGEYDDPSYEAYDNSYATQTQSTRRMGHDPFQPKGTTSKKNIQKKMFGVHGEGGSTLSANSPSLSKNITAELKGKNAGKAGDKEGELTENGYLKMLRNKTLWKVLHIQIFGYAKSYGIESTDCKINLYSPNIMDKTKYYPGPWKH